MLGVLPHDDRYAVLRRSVADELDVAVRPDLDLDAALDDLIADPARCWRRPWLATCAAATRASST